MTLTSWFLCPSLPAGLLRFQTHTHMLRVSAGLDIGACKQSFCHLIPGLKSKWPLRSGNHRMNLEFPGLIWISTAVSETEEILGIALGLGENTTSEDLEGFVWFWSLLWDCSIHVTRELLVSPKPLSRAEHLCWAYCIATWSSINPKGGSAWDHISRH